MSANSYTPVIPINEYVTLQTEMSKLKAQYEALQAQVNQNHLGAPTTIYVKDQGITKILLLTEVILMEADSNYTTIHLANGSSILTSKTLKYWLEKIGNNDDFIRPHRSFVVNKKYLVSYQANPRSIIISGNKVIPMSRNFDIKDHGNK